MRKMVRVTGEVQDLWQTLLGVLYSHGYEIETQNPCTQLTAKRGSKVSSMLLEGTKGGFRQLNVTSVPQEGKEIEVRFEFDFPSWAITLPATKQECDQLVDEFVRQAGQGEQQAQLAAGANMASDQTRSCPSCGVQVALGAKFCDSCGAALAAKACAKCGAAVRPEARFCDNCGGRI
jgi:hypothetical protein